MATQSGMHATRFGSTARLSASCLLAAGLWLAVVQGAAAVPEILSYQGVLLLSDGTVAPDGEYKLEFTVWPQAGGGSSPHFLQELTVAVEDGLYNVLLSVGSGGTKLSDAFQADDTPRFMQVRIVTWSGDDAELGLPTTLTPRQQIGSVPYALTAGSVPTQEFVLVDRVELLDATEHTFSDLDGDRDKRYRLVFSGLVTPNSGTFRLVARPNGTIADARSWQYWSGGSKSEDDGFLLLHTGQNSVNYVALEYVLHAESGRNRLAYGLATNSWGTGNNDARVSRTGGHWRDTTDLVSSLWVGTTGTGGTVSGTLELYRAR